MNNTNLLIFLMYLDFMQLYCPHSFLWAWKFSRSATLPVCIVHAVYESALLFSIEY